MENFLWGVNFHGFSCALRQNGQVTPSLPQQLPPDEYMDDSFRIFKQSGIQCIRVPLYWESYERNPECFNQELDSISSLADKYGISCIYDNHQWKCSSYFGDGIGFPNSLLESSFGEDLPAINSAGHPSKQILKRFWNGWWDRKLKTTEGKECWDAQLEFLEGVINRIEEKNSTLGFEILNEPMIFRQADFGKVGIYHDYFIKHISALTDETFNFCICKPAYNVANKIIFDIHPYPPNSLTMGYYKSICWLMKNISVYAWEFNAGINPGIKINGGKLNEYVGRLRNFKLSGCALWEWSYIPDISRHAFNLTCVIDGKIQPNNNFKSFTDTIK